MYHQVVLNTKVSGRWHDEKRILANLPPFEDGKPFNVRIECLAREFKILFDENVGDFFPYLAIWARRAQMARLF